MTSQGSNRLIIRMSALALTAALAACGSTSNIRPSAKPEAVAATSAQQHVAPIDVSGYDKVIVLDFIDATEKHALSADKARSYSDSMATAVRTFPDLIAQKVRETGAFREVVRSAGPGAGPGPGPVTAPGKALSISGRITRLAEGNGALRFWIGMGAGSSYFDATTDLSDAESGQVLGQVATGKNSWVLGGGIAATQTVESFMQGAAEKIAAQLRDSKQGPAVVKRN